MTQTKIEVLINHILDTFPTNTSIGGYPLQVIDGPGAADIRNNVLFVGHSLIATTQSASGAQQWAAVGRIPPTRKEDLELNCSLRIGVGNRQMRECRAKAITIFAAIAEGLRGSVAAFTANGELQQLQLSRYRLYQEFSTDGASVTLEFSISATARV